MQHQQKHTDRNTKRDMRYNRTEGNVLDRDQSGKVSVASEKGGGPSYTHNAEKSEPLDPHLSDDNKPELRTSSEGNSDTVLDRDRSGVVSVSSKEKDGEPSYTHNADSSKS